MLVTDDGISRLANELHPSKACSPMPSTDDGIATRTNALQPLNAPASMRVTEDGRATTNGFFLSTSPHAFDMERVMVGVPCGTSICSGVLLLYCPRTGPRAGNGGGMAPWHLVLLCMYAFITPCRAFGIAVVLAVLGGAAAVSVKVAPGRPVLRGAPVKIFLTLRNAPAIEGISLKERGVVWRLGFWVLVGDG